MRTNNQQYQTPALISSGDLVETTRANKQLGREEDQTPEFPIGSVGFGI